MTPKTVDTGISNGNTITRPTMSHSNTKDAPSKATAGRLWRSLSPIRRLMMFGTTKPINGILPTVTTTKDVIRATIISPDHRIAVLFSPKFTLTVSPKPKIVSWSAIK